MKSLINIISKASEFATTAQRLSKTFEVFGKALQVFKELDGIWEPKTPVENGKS